MVVSRFSQRQENGFSAALVMRRRGSYAEHNATDLKLESDSLPMAGY